MDMDKTPNINVGQYSGIWYKNGKSSQCSAKWCQKCLKHIAFCLSLAMQPFGHLFCADFDYFCNNKRDSVSKKSVMFVYRGCGHNVWCEDECVFCSAVVLVLVALVVVGTLLDIHHVHATSMRRDLLYHVSTNVRHLVGSRDGHMTWTTVDESVVSSDPVTSDSQTNDDQASGDAAESQRLQHPPSARLLVEAFRYKPGLISQSYLFLQTQ